MITEMCRRVNLPIAVGNRIRVLALQWAITHNHAQVDMVLVAQAISYAAKNKHLLKRNY